MGDLDLTVADGEQPGVCERREHRFGAIDSLELGKRQAATDKRALLAVREPQQEAPRNPPLRLVEPSVRILGEPATAPRTPPLAAYSRAQHAPVARPPQLEQHRGQQRQPTGLTGHVGDQILDQRTLDDSPAQPPAARSPAPAPHVASARPANGAS